MKMRDPEELFGLCARVCGYRIFRDGALPRAYSVRYYADGVTDSERRAAFVELRARLAAIAPEFHGGLKLEKVGKDAEEPRDTCIGCCHMHDNTFCIHPKLPINILADDHKRAPEWCPLKQPAG